MTADLQKKLETIPRRPGVYLMKDAAGRILYVGKANRLDQRLRTHFSGASDHPKQVALIARVHDVDVIATDSEVDALILEMTLIKEKRPPYNINLKDDKRFPLVKVTVQEEWPRILLTRKVKEDGARYFGPYTDVRALRLTLRNLRTVFPVRSCPGARPGRGPARRECLDYYIHRCLAPCIHPGLAAEYRRAVDDFCQFLAGDAAGVVARLRADMDGHAERLEYEAASRRRDQIALVERMQQRQRMVDVQKRDTDLFAFTRAGDTAWGVVFQVREGRVLGREKRLLRGVAAASDAEVMAELLKQYYVREERFPREIATMVEPADAPLLAAWLEARAGRTVAWIVPRKGKLAHLVQLALRNARLDMEEARGIRERGEIDPAVYELQSALGLERPPVRIECVDISNIQGAHPVASLVVQVNGRAARGDYRRYRMRTPGPDDFAMMREVIGRRAARIQAGEFAPPDLLVVDGGIGQLGAVREALAAAGLASIPTVGLAKREEELILPDRAEPVRLPKSAPALKLLIRLRDEAHRFAITYHRKLRGKAALRSSLDDIPGVGEERRLRLLHHFGSVDAVTAATEHDLADVPGFGPAIARRIWRALHPGDGGVAA
jgi:excinuclease ABC subunit C